GGDPLLGGAAADIEEVGGLAAIELDDVHGRHGEAGAVHHAADAAFELDVVERVLRRLELGGVLLGLVAHLLDLLVAEERVVVEIHLGVERDDRAGAGHHQRVDLDHRGVEAGEGTVHAEHELGRRRYLLALEAEAIGELPRVEALQAGGRIDRHLEDLLGVPGGDFLDLHAAFGRGHDGDARGLAVDQHAEIELALDVAALLDVDALHLAALGAGLLGDEHVAEHLGGVLADLLDGFDDAHAALALRIVFEAAGAAAAGMDLRLHHPDRPADVARHLFRLLRR